MSFQTKYGSGRAKRLCILILALPLDLLCDQLCWLLCACFLLLDPGNALPLESTEKSQGVCFGREIASRMLLKPITVRASAHA